MFRSAPRQSVPQNVLFSSSQTYTQGCGLLKFFSSYSEPVFLPENSLLTLHSNIVPLRNLMEGNIVPVLLPSVTFWHHEVSSSYHHYFRNTLVRKLSSVLPQSIMFCPLICTSLTMFSPHVTISRNPMNGDFSSPPHQLCSWDFLLTLLLPESSISILPTPEIFKEIPRSGNLFSILLWVISWTVVSSSSHSHRKLPGWTKWVWNTLKKSSTERGSEHD